LVYLLAVIVYALDQLTKWMVTSHLHMFEQVGVFPPVLYLDYIRNPGGAWSIFPNQSWLFILVAVIVVGVAIYIERKTKLTVWYRVALGLVLGGALGNMTDRIVSHSVVDFIYFKIINYPVFNVADIGIVVGILMIVWGTFAPSRKKTKR